MKKQPLAVGSVIGLVILLSLALRPGAASIGHEEQWRPVRTADEAIAKTLARVDKPISRRVARLVYISEVDAFMGVKVHYDQTDYAATTPTWLVGVLGDDFRGADVPFHGDDQRRFAGLFFAWDARNGQIMAQGTLELGSYQQIVNMTNRDIPIVAATPVIPGRAQPLPTATPARQELNPRASLWSSNGR